MSLSSQIVQREVATMRQVEEALARQVLYGGDLITNLLEVAAVDERALTELVAESAGLQALPPGEIHEPTERARAVVPTEVATQRGLIPLDVQNGKLIIAVAEPLSASLAQQLSFTLGLAIEQRIAPFFRIRQALNKTYRVPLDRRIARLVARLNGETVLGRDSTPPPPLSAIPAKAEPPRVPSIPPAAPTGTNRSPTQVGFPAPPAAPKSLLPTSDLPSSTRKSQLPPPPGAPRTAPGGAQGASLIQKQAQAMRPARRRRGPLTLEQAKKEIEPIEARDELLGILFDFSRQFFDYTVLFLVHGDIAEGRDAFGDGTSRDRIVGIGVPLDFPSVLATARETRRPVVARPSKEGLDPVLFGDLGRPLAEQVIVAPVVVRSRPVALLFGDCGDNGVDSSHCGEVIALAAAVGHAFEKIILKKKRRSLTPAGTPAAKRLDLLAERNGSDPKAAKGGALDAAFPPLPENVLAVRRPSGPPIPREEPAPELEVMPLDDESARAFLEELGLDDSGPDVTIHHAPQERYDRSSALAPASASVVIPPHKPPTSYDAKDSALPSIMVDLDTEFALLIDRFLRDPEDENIEGELLRQGPRAMPAIMNRFPGPVSSEPTATHETLPRVSECGPLLRLIVRERRAAVPSIIVLQANANPDVRFWATYLITEMPYVDAIGSVSQRFADDDVKVRRVARAAASAIAKQSPQATVEELARRTVDGDAKHRIAAIDTLTHVREVTAVPVLIDLLADSNSEIADAARRGLVAITRQDFEHDGRKWLAWWTANQTRHRVEWLIDALVHEVFEIRRAASDELRALTRESYGFSPEGASKDREKAQQRYRDWWVTEGRNRPLRR